jgi:hypothetical protein
MQQLLLQEMAICHLLRQFWICVIEAACMTCYCEHFVLYMHRTMILMYASFFIRKSNTKLFYHIPLS